MKKIIAFLGAGAVMIALCAGIVACRDDNTKEKEPEGVSLDEALRGNAPEQLVPKESLPQWLIEKIDIHTAYPSSSTVVKVYRGELEGEMYYYIYDLLQSCLVCDVYNKNGETVADGKKLRREKIWVLIWQLIGDGFTRSEFVDDGKETDDEYEYPIKPGTPEWNKFDSIKALIDALQIPDGVQATLT